jgi:hypothetical protein
VARHPAAGFVKLLNDAKSRERSERPTLGVAVQEAPAEINM